MINDNFEKDLIEKELNPKQDSLDVSLAKLAGGGPHDSEFTLFIVEWLHNGFNASAAYKKQHPNVSDASARVLGSRRLAKVNTSAILAAYDLGIEDYMADLKKGLKATKRTPDGEEVPDYKTRIYYHRVLGKILGIEK